MSNVLFVCLAGLAAGSVNGLFGAGGGMVLVPLLNKTGLAQEQVFPCSVVIILPICVISLLLSGSQIPWDTALPYLLGSAVGGIGAGLWGKKIPVLWLHRALGLLILWGGVRYLC